MSNTYQAKRNDLVGKFLEEPQNGDVWDKGIKGGSGGGWEGNGEQKGLVGARF